MVILLYFLTNNYFNHKNQENNELFIYEIIFGTLFVKVILNKS